MASRRHAQDGCVPDRRACFPPPPAPPLLFRGLLSAACSRGSASGGEAASAAAPRRAEGGVRSPGGGRPAAQQDAPSKLPDKRPSPSARRPLGRAPLFSPFQFVDEQSAEVGEKLRHSGRASSRSWVFRQGGRRCPPPVLVKRGTQVGSNTQAEARVCRDFLPRKQRCAPCHRMLPAEAKRSFPAARRLR